MNLKRGFIHYKKVQGTQKTQRLMTFKTLGMFTKSFILTSHRIKEITIILSFTDFF